MPVVRVRHHLGVGETAHLVAHLVERLVEAGVAEGSGLRLRGDQLREPRRVASAQPSATEVGRGVLEAAHLLARHAERCGPHRLALAHGDAPGDLRQVLAETAGDEQPLGRAEAARFLEPSGPRLHLPQRLDVSRNPRQPVPRGLHRVEAAGRGDTRPHGRLGMVQKPLGRSATASAQRPTRASRSRPIEACAPVCDMRSLASRVAASAAAPPCCSARYRQFGALQRVFEAIRPQRGMQSTRRRPRRFAVDARHWTMRSAGRHGRALAGTRQAGSGPARPCRAGRWGDQRSQRWA